MDEGLRASFHTGNVVTHGVEAGLGGVDLNDGLEGGLAPLKLLFPHFALGLAIFNE